VKRFLADYDLSGDGSSVNANVVATIAAANTMKPENLPEVPLGLKRGSRGNNVKQIQKLMRYLGYYKGRTDGVFDADVKKAVIAFQLKKGVIDTEQTQVAGLVGPGTKAALLQAWKSKVVAVKAKAIVMKMEIADRVKTDLLPSKVLAKGDRGEQVKQLQRVLIRLGYLDPKDVTGTFGDRTAKALLTYQTEKNIVASSTQKGAGVFGPVTRKTLLSDVADSAWQQVRSDGIGSL
jgi:peptidoglycan hydrolase-like protein with peptidoglycan-binding domain